MQSEIECGVAYIITYMCVGMAHVVVCEKTFQIDHYHNGNISLPMDIIILVLLFAVNQDLCNT